MALPENESPSGSEARIFLSYAAEDRERARQLAEDLESRGWSVWWDHRIPIGRAFDEVIEEALRQARCVVVLWTKAAVASRWVRAEASDAARREILVPVLAEDVSIPLEFRLYQALDLRAQNVSSRAAALDALHDAIARVAGGPPFTAIAATREAQGPTARIPRMGQFQAVLVVGALLLLSVLGGGLWYWDAFYRSTFDYFANVTTRWGLPEGIGPLSAEQVSRRNVSVVLIRRGRRNPADEVRVVNSAGLTPAVGQAFPNSSMAALNPLPSAGTDGPVSSELVQLTRVTFTRDAGGHLLEQAGFNRGGRRLYTIRFAEPNLGEFKQEGFGMPMRESGISYLRFSRITGGPHAGFDERVQYLDDKRRPQPDENGAYGYRLVYGNGLVTELVNCGPDGADKVNNHGVLKEQRSHDQLGNIVEATTLDDKGAPMPSVVGAAVVRMQYDSAGNITRMSFFDTKSQPFVAESLGAAGMEFTYDRQGNFASEAFYGPDQRLTVGRLGFAKYTMEWRGARQSLGRSFDANGQPIPAAGGSFEALVTWEARGFPIETTYRDDKGEAMRTEDGCATVGERYDEVGNLSEMRCLNEHGALTISSIGSSSTRFTYDGRGNRLSTAFYDLRGAPGRVDDFYSSIQYAYNASGSLERETYLNAPGRPVKSRAGFASASYAYDTSGNQVAVVYCDEIGHRTNGAEGYASIRRTFNERRLEVETAYFDSADRPVESREGFAAVRYEYDQRGFINRIRRFGTDGKPTKGFDGYSSARIKRNEAGQRLEFAFFDESDAPMVAARFGSAKRQWTYDRAGRVIARSDQDAAGRPVINAYGYSTLRYLYDQHGREVGRELLDLQGRILEFKLSVDRITQGSVAADVGLKVGDLVLTYDGQTVSTSEHFTNTLERYRGDRGRELRIDRDRQVLSLDLPPGRLHGLELAERVPAARTDGRQ
jgi:hypothetical protein